MSKVNCFFHYNYFFSDLLYDNNIPETNPIKKQLRITNTLDIDNLKVKNFIFRDPVFSIDRKHTVKICEAIISRGIKFNICIEVHLKNIDDELTKILPNDYGNYLRRLLDK